MTLFAYVIDGQVITVQTKHGPILTIDPDLQMLKRFDAQAGAIARRLEKPLELATFVRQP